MYALLLKLMFLFPPERIHHLVFIIFRLAAQVPVSKWLMKKIFCVNDPILHSQVFGIDFAAPLGLAAGFDKDALGIKAWGPLGFGFAEIGTITAQPQPGNPQPRLFRLPKDRALINRMGFNNHGAQAAAAQLQFRSSDFPIAANIGKTKIVPAADAAEDYRTSATALGPYADFIIVNVSS
ncbi:MAG: dihydroorotate dehydrogenase (quinone), partial [Mycobacteriaceae bacterium]